MQNPIAAAAAALLISSGAATAVPGFYRGENFSGPAHVVDGDTITVSGAEPIRVRLFGIDAPESRQTCARADGAPYACGTEATAFLHQLVEGRAVTCTTKDTDRYHRVVAQCVIDGRDIGAEMIRAGQAIEFRRYTSIYDGEEQQARNAKRGLWAGTFADPSDYRRAKREGAF